MKPGDVIPSNSVIIPADVAKEIATHFRKVNAGPNSRNEKWADLLDPQPPALREQAVAAFRKAALDRDWNLEDDGEDAVARVRALHQTWNAILFGEEPRGTCAACVEAYPCATIRALDGKS